MEKPGSNQQEELEAVTRQLENKYNDLKGSGVEGDIERLIMVNNQLEGVRRIQKSWKNCDQFYEKGMEALDHIVLLAQKSKETQKELRNRNNSVREPTKPVKSRLINLSIILLVVAILCVLAIRGYNSLLYNSPNAYHTT
eukprot:TRINITY_DN18878_c0_g1_i1.p1 TRINITY_DN18878_c0_g1~~TRINITY_DN18878_c0_g1_i1.p1  ORF type:complete len:140 (+),score=17.96 TRINITY_DN18878_c0_g1_i1:10-429(+)